MPVKKQSGEREQKAQEEAKDLGSRLRYYRETVLRQSIKKIAGRARIAPATLRSLEDGAGKTKLATVLQAIRHGYGLERGLQQLLSLPRDAEDESPVARWSGPDALTTNSGEVEEYRFPRAAYYLLNARPHDPQMEVAIVRLSANSTTEKLLQHHHGGDEILIGIEGTTQLIRKHRDSDEIETHTIEQHQLVVHRASIEHYAKNPSEDEECMYIVIRAPFGLTSLTPAADLERPT